MPSECLRAIEQHQNFRPAFPRLQCSLLHLNEINRAKRQYKFLLYDRAKASKKIHERSEFIVAFAF